MLNIITDTFSRLLKYIRYGEYIPTEHFIFNDKKLIYISIPKVACTSIKIGLMANNQPESASHDQYMNVHSDTRKFVSHAIPRDCKDYYSFAFVRNPFDRLVSCYKDKVQKHIQHNGRYHFNTNYNHVIIKKLYGDIFTPDMTFDDFVLLVSRIPDKLSDGHFKSQYSMLYKNGNLVPNFVGKFESINEDWSHLAKQYQLTRLGEKNRTTSSDWRTYYTSADTLKLAAERYREDIEKFGYDQSYKSLLQDLN